jgi:hypothetical protein
LCAPRCACINLKRYTLEQIRPIARVPEATEQATLDFKKAKVIVRMDIDRRGKLATTDAIDATDAAAVTTRRDIDMTLHDDDFIRNPRTHANVNV